MRKQSQLFKNNYIKKNSKKPIFTSKEKWGIAGFFLFTFVLISLLTGYDALADETHPGSRDGATNDGVAIKNASWYNANADILTTSSLPADAFRWIGFGVCKFAAAIANAAETLFDKTFGMIDITKYSEVNKLISDIKPILWGSLALCIVFYGIVMMIKRDYKPPFVQNIVLGAIIVIGGTTLMTTLTDLTADFKSATLGKNNTQVYATFNNSIYDLTENQSSVASWSGESSLKHTKKITKSNISNIDINETLCWYHDGSGEHGQAAYGWNDTFNNIIKYRSVGNGIAQVPDGITSQDIGNEFYYRYDWDFVNNIL